MIVPRLEPKSMKAPRPLKSFQAEQQCQYEPERAGAPLQRRAADRIVKEPRACQHGERNGNRRRLGQRCDRRVDQIRLGALEVQQAQQREARQPRRVRLPVEPMQRGRQFAWRDPVLLRHVEPAAMHGPEFAGQIVVARARRLQVIVEPDEVERGTDPGDAGDQMQPARQ
jgi:hypothetical protein